MIIKHIKKNLVRNKVLQINYLQKWLKELDKVLIKIDYIMFNLK